jgi:hypothetical protein
MPISFSFVKLSTSLSAAALLLTTGCFSSGSSGGGMTGMSGRVLTVFQSRPMGAAPDPYPVDVSQLPPDAVTHNETQGGSRRVIMIRDDYPVKIIIVPATTQP